MSHQRIAGIAELGLALVCVVAGIWQWSVGVHHSRTPVQLPTGAEQWLTVYDGPQIVSAFALLAGAVLLVVDAVVRLHRARQTPARPSAAG